MSDLYLEPEITVTFELEGAIPIFKETYVSAQAGKTVLKGLFSPRAHLETLDGVQYRMLSPRRDDARPNEVAYPLARLPEKTEILRLLTPSIVFSDRNRQHPPLRFTCRFDSDVYILRRTPSLGRAFEIWDGMEMHRIVRREHKSKLILDAVVMDRVPVLLVLLLPWLDNQTLS